MFLYLYIFHVSVPVKAIFHEEIQYVSARRKFCLDSWRYVSVLYTGHEYSISRDPFSLKLTRQRSITVRVFRPANRLTSNYNYAESPKAVHNIANELTKQAERKCVCGSLMILEKSNISVFSPWSRQTQPGCVTTASFHSLLQSEQSVISWRWSSAQEKNQHLVVPNTYTGVFTYC